MKESEVPRSIRLEELTGAITSLQARVARIEAQLDLPSTRSPETGPPPEESDPQSEQAPPVPASLPQLPSLGYAILMLAGAFLLRALTESRVLDATFGILLGLAYTLTLLFLTHRAAGQGDRSRSTMFGAATALVVFPLVWETSTRLDLLAPPGAAGVIIMVTALAVGLAVRHHLAALGFLFLMAAVTTATGLYWTTGATTLFAALVISLGVAAVWLAYLRDWQGPQWLIAAAANFLVFLSVARASGHAEQLADRPDSSLTPVLCLALALPIVYLGSFSLRTMLQKREAGAFEIVQSLGCLLAGYLGAVRLLRATDGGTVALGLVTLLAAAAGYGVAFTFVRQEQGRGLNFFYHAWLGLLLTLLGTALVVSGPWLPILWAGLAVMVALAGGRYDRWTLRLHCATYLIGAATLTGMPAAVFDAFTGPAAGELHRLAGPCTTVWILAFVCYGLLVSTHRRCELAAWRRLPRFIIALIVLAGAGNLLVVTLNAWLTSTFPGSEEATLAVIRTVVLATTTMGLAAASQRRPVLELGWFVNPLLVLTALKLLLEDLRRGTPISLFFGFAVFGTALIVASRWRRLTAHDGA